MLFDFVSSSNLLRSSARGFILHKHPHNQKTPTVSELAL